MITIKEIISSKAVCQRCGSGNANYAICIACSHCFAPLPQIFLCRKCLQDLTKEALDLLAKGRKENEVCV